MSKIARKSNRTPVTDEEKDFLHANNVSHLCHKILESVPQYEGGALPYLRRELLRKERLAQGFIRQILITDQLVATGNEKVLQTNILYPMVISLAQNLKMNTQVLKDIPEGKYGLYTIQEWANEIQKMLDNMEYGCPFGEREMNMGLDNGIGMG